jgi:hypothetical protein
LSDTGQRSTLLCWICVKQKVVKIRDYFNRVYIVILHFVFTLKLHFTFFFFPNKIICYLATSTQQSHSGYIYTVKPVLRGLLWDKQRVVKVIDSQTWPCGHLYWKVIFFLSRHRKCHMNLTSFLIRPLFVCPKGDLLIQVWLYIYIQNDFVV